MILIADLESLVGRGGKMLGQGWAAGGEGEEGRRGVDGREVVGDGNAAWEEDGEGGSLQ